MDRHTFRDKVLFYLTVPKCVCCNTPLSLNDAALCPSCSVAYRNAKKRDCGVCFNPISLCQCSPPYLKKHCVSVLYKVTRYFPKQEDNPSNALIYSLKQDHSQKTVRFISDELSLGIDEFRGREDVILTNVPRRRKGIRKYGYDHAAYLAKALAEKLSLPYVSCLKSNARTAQKGLHGIDRKVNASFSLKRNVSFQGKTVILVDDVVTTGSSMGNAAMELKGAGVKKIVGACFAIAYHDPYISFDN